MQTMELTTASGRIKRNRADAAVQTLANTRNRGDSPAELAHDARNMVTALALYCDLLEEPGVLAQSFQHYGGELRLVVAASRRLVEKLALLDSREVAGCASDRPLNSRDRVSDSASLHGTLRTRAADMLPSDPINNLQEELLASRNLLDAMAGMSIVVTVETRGGALPVKLTGEDLTRVLVNMVKNAAESLLTSGTIQIALCERHGLAGGTSSLLLSVEDTGPGIPEDLLEKVFEAGFSTRPHRTSAGKEATGGWLARHRGLGLSITRSIIQAAGGQIRVENSARGGARFEIDLPVRS